MMGEGAFPTELSKPFLLKINLIAGSVILSSAWDVHKVWLGVAVRLYVIA
jgi:hypothetical protein